MLLTSVSGRTAAGDGQDLTGHGRALAGAGRLDEALVTLLDATAANPGDVGAHLAIYEVAQLLGRPDLALEHQRRAIALAPVHSTLASGRPEYTLLAPMVPGLYVANTPVDLLFDTTRVSLHRWYVDADGSVPPLPAFDAVFVAAGESTAAQPALRALQRFTAACGVPVLNAPTEIAKLGRVAFAQTFAGARFSRVPPAVRMTRDEYAADGYPTPHIVRPVDSHGGHGLERIDDDAARAAYVAALAADEVYVTEFVDYRSDDGFYRKYRIIFVDGEPFPFHLAISPRWMVHYYNAPMAENAWMRDEEHAFLAHMGNVFHGELADALREVSSLLPLEYVGIDCAIGRDGKLLVFEADNALIVHLLDDPQVYAYKYRYVPRVAQAVDAMVRRRLGRA
jgi:tetratricopeptide (TPR) repeat protein